MTKGESTYELFQQWCKETKRNGGVVIGSSIKEFCDWLDARESQPTPEETTNNTIYSLNKTP